MPPLDLQALLKDTDVLPALMDLLPRMETTSSSGVNPSLLLLSRLAVIDDPAITDLVLKNMGNLRSGDRFSILRGMLASGRGDPRIRAALERISVEDPDPNLRQYAADLLKTP